MSIFLPSLLLVQIMHWVGLLLDELLFRGYRATEIRQPVFVLGVPRSGTTATHRLLATDPAFTTLTTWECLFAPSITERYFWLTVARIDQALGSPFRRIIGYLERELFGRLDSVHPIGLGDAEEDYMVLMPILSCFILVIPFPESPWLWRMGRFDRDVDPRERAAILGWYEHCLKRHLYVHGSDRTMLCKNASFAGMANSLADFFPDCRLVVCQRDALQAVNSQFNSLSTGMALFGGRVRETGFRQNLLDCLRFYYQNLARVEGRLGDRRHTAIAMQDLSQRPREVIDGIYRLLERDVPGEILGALDRQVSRGPHVPHQLPPLSTWGLEERIIRERFTPFLRSVRARS